MNLVHCTVRVKESLCTILSEFEASKQQRPARMMCLPGENTGEVSGS